MEETGKFGRTFEKFEKAFNKYKEIVETPHLFEFLNEELIIEIATKRFEYTFESMWKTLKEYLKNEGIDCATPLGCFKDAFKVGIIKEEHEKVFVEMIKKRNDIVHTYDFNQAKINYEFVKKDEVFKAIKSVYEKLKDNKPM